MSFTLLRWLLAAPPEPNDPPRFERDGADEVLVGGDSPEDGEAIVGAGDAAEDGVAEDGVDVAAVATYEEDKPESTVV